MLWFRAKSPIPNNLMQLSNRFKGEGLDWEKKPPVTLFLGKVLSFVASYSWQQMSANQMLNTTLS